MTSPCPSLPLRATAAALCLQLLLTGCSATAQSVVWPQPAPLTLPAPAFVAQPNFQAPSAAHCARPSQTREVPGASHSQSGATPSPRLREHSAKAMADDIDTRPAGTAVPHRPIQPCRSRGWPPGRRTAQRGQRTPAPF